MTQVVKSGPQQVQKYYFIVARHLERAKAALKSNPDLEHFLKHPVQQICGPESKLPTTWQLLRKKGYVSTTQVFAELGIPVGGRAAIRQEDVLTRECPVPVFTYARAGQRFCRREDAETLKEFVRKSLGL